MENFTLPQRVEIVKHYYGNSRSPSMARQSIRQKCKWENYPSEELIHDLIQKLNTTYTLWDDPVESNKQDPVVVVEPQTNGTKKSSTSRRRAGSKAPEALVEINEVEDASTEAINSTTAKKSSKGRKKETKKSTSKSKGPKKTVIENNSAEDDVLPQEEFVPEEEVKVSKPKKTLKSKASQKQLKDVEPMSVDEEVHNEETNEQEEAPVVEEGKKSRARKTPVKKVAEKKVSAKKSARTKKETITEEEMETELEAEPQISKELDADIESSESKLNGRVAIKAESEKKGGRGRKRAAPVPTDEDDETDGIKLGKIEGFLNPTVTEYKGKDFNIDKEFKLKISSWNIAGLRSWLKKDGLEYLQHEQPDILCLQETKCTPDQVPEEARIPGYHPYWLCMPGGHAGVALYSKIMPIHVEYGIGDPEQDEAGRLITAEYEKFYLICVYVPNSGRKLVNLEKRMQWEALFRDYIQRLDKVKPVVIAGDMNVAHKEIDLANPKTNTKNAGFTPEERDAMTKLLELGYVDTFRHLYPDQKGAYSFWSYMGKARSKNVGWRLDYFIISQRAASKVVESTMRAQVLGSDHCPITLFLNI